MVVGMRNRESWLTFVLALVVACGSGDSAPAPSCGPGTMLQGGQCVGMASGGSAGMGVTAGSPTGAGGSAAGSAPDGGATGGAADGGAPTPDASDAAAPIADADAAPADRIDEAVDAGPTPPPRWLVYGASSG